LILVLEPGFLKMFNYFVTFCNTFAELYEILRAKCDRNNESQSYRNVVQAVGSRFRLGFTT